MPRSGTLDLRSVAERRLFWFLRAVLKLSSLCKAAADTAREEPSAILLLTTKQLDRQPNVFSQSRQSKLSLGMGCSSCRQGRGRRPTEACLRPRRCARPTHKLRQAQAASTFPPLLLLLLLLLSLKHDPWIVQGGKDLVTSPKCFWLPAESVKESCQTGQFFCHNTGNCEDYHMPVN